MPCNGATNDPQHAFPRKLPPLASKVTSTSMLPARHFSQLITTATTTIDDDDYCAQNECIPLTMSTAKS